MHRLKHIHNTIHKTYYPYIYDIKYVECFWIKSCMLTYITAYRRTPPPTVQPYTAAYHSLPTLPGWVDHAGIEYMCK